MMRAEDPTEVSVSLIASPHPHSSMLWGRGYEALFGVSVVLAALAVTSAAILAAVCLATWLVFSLVMLFLSRKRCARYYDRPGNPRLVCYGDPEEMQALERIELEAFDPVIIQSSSYEQSPAWRLLPFVIFLVVLYCILRSLRVSPALSFLTTILVIGVSQVAFHFAWPIYYRVSPGYLQVLRCHPLSGKLKSSAPVDIRDSRIRCRYDKRILTIEDSRDDAEPIVIHLGRIPRMQMLVEAVFRAALCRHSTPALPEGELLG